MKIFFKKIAILSFLAVMICSCEDPAGEEEWGFSLLYMPQAVLQSGGNDNNYFVDIEASTSADSTVVVGVYRSGLAPLEAVSVELVIDEVILQTYIANSNQPDAPSSLDAFKNAVLLDPSYYEIPLVLNISNGKRENSDVITIHKDLLLQDPAPSGTSFILPVRIQNPTRYELNDDLSFTFFIFKRD